MSETEKQKVEKILLDYNKQLYSKIFIELHNHLLQTDRKYFKDYCARTGMPERKLKAILKLKYNGTLSDLMVLLRRAGLYVHLKLADETPPATIKENEKEKPNPPTPKAK